jgi:hypothetical protein
MPEHREKCCIRYCGGGSHLHHNTPPAMRCRSARKGVSTDTVAAPVCGRGTLRLWPRPYSGMLRLHKNQAGQPAGERRSREQAYATLAIFHHYNKLLYSLINWLTANAATTLRAGRRHGTSSTGLGLAEILFKRVEHVVHRGAFAAVSRGEPLLDGLDGLQTLSKIEKPLVGRRVLDDEFGFAVDRQHDGIPGFLQLAEEFRSVTFEVGKGMDVLTEIHLAESHHFPAYSNSFARLIGSPGRPGSLVFAQAQPLPHLLVSQVVELLPEYLGVQLGPDQPARRAGGR